MTFRRRLLSVFAFTVVLSVTTVLWIVSVVTRRAFERIDDERTAALVAQFHREFDRRGRDVVRRVDAIAGSEPAARMASAVSQGSPDYGAFLNESKTIAEDQQLGFLEFIDSRGTIISSAQWPAKFGYKANMVPSDASVTKEAVLRQQETPDGSLLALCAIRKVNADNSLYVIGGRRLDKDFLASLELPAGMRVLFYQNLTGSFSAKLLIDPSGTLRNPEKLEPIIEQVEQQSVESSAIVHWTDDAGGDEAIHAIPLKGDNNQILGILLAGNSRRSYVDLRRYIRSAALLAAGAGLVLAILFSSWAAARVTRPVVQLASVAREVAAGNWYAQAEVASSDELGELADSFNRMTRDLLDQRERLVQTERVAAWRELARRLAHELKNPLFPLQLTVENLLRARQQQTPEQFEEIFQESAATLLAELANLKTVIGRFSEFSRMPQPQWQQVDLNEIARNVARLFQAQLHSTGRAAIECKLELSEPLRSLEADPDLLHRAISNLVLNAMDAMPQGGTLTLQTRQEGDRMFISVADTGTGLTPEECERLFTPYYTSKTHGTGLGLAIVQSVVSDHHGRISVSSRPGGGTTFLIELPRVASAPLSSAFTNWKGIS